EGEEIGVTDLSVGYRECVKDVESSDQRLKGEDVIIIDDETLKGCQVLGGLRANRAPFSAHGRSVQVVTGKCRYPSSSVHLWHSADHKRNSTPSKSLIASTARSLSCCVSGPMSAPRTSFQRR